MTELVQRGPRAHHFVSGISVAVALSFIFEVYAFNTPFLVLGDLLRIPVSGQALWGYAMLFLGLVIILPWNIYVRAIALVLSTSLWVLFGGIALWAALFGPNAATAGSYTGILSLGIASCSLLAITNLKRDFLHGRRQVDTRS